MAMGSELAISLLHMIDEISSNAIQSLFLDTFRIIHVSNKALHRCRTKKYRPIITKAQFFS